MNADFQRVKDIFLATLERDAGAARSAYLNEACGQDVELRQRVDALLARHEAAGSFLESRASAVDPYPTVDEPADGEGAGMVIGPYKLLQQIGEGGMGTVYMAEQTHPVHRNVALKIIRPGMDSRQVIARFEAERQALALMDHPNIAKVLDAGTTDSPLAPILGGEGSGVRGRPYFVMELVKGVSITKYCDEHHLTPRERLELFVPICQAVQHAHQKGIIHRDLKPSNVLVALYDGKPVPKVIDFGVAKAMGQKLTDETLFTQFGQVVGTLEYMSPEQAEPNQLDIDTRSDIYSLGVLLYELLTGTTPIQRKRLKQAAILEALRIIREEEPPKPSTRLSTTEELPSIAANRGLEPKKLSGLVRGELDWIVMKCLEKDRNRRYETANGLAHDIERYLHDEPVQASPPSATYRLRKFARRHKTALAMTSLAASLLVVTSVILAISNVWVRRERDEKQEALEQKAAALAVAKENARKAHQAVDDYFTQVSESDLFAAGLEPLRKQLLDAALQYYKEFVDQAPEDPKLQAELAAAYFRIWQIYRSVNRYADSMAALRKALDIAERLRREHPGNTEVLGTLATVRYGQLRFVGSLHAQFDAGSTSDIAEAIRTLERGAALWATLAAENPRIPDFQRNLGEVYDELANLQRGTNDPLRALETARKAFAVWEKLAQEYPPMVAGGREKEYRGAILAVYLREGGYPDEAQRLFQVAIDFAQKQAEQFPKERQHRSSLAFLYRRLGESFSVYSWRPKKAEQPWQRAISLYENLVAEHPGITSYPWHLGDCCVQLGHVFRNTGRPQEAEQYYSRSLKVFHQLASAYPDSVGYMDNARHTRLLLARLCSDARRFDEAENHYRQALELAERIVAGFPNEASEVGSAYRDFAEFLVTCPDAKFRKLAQAVILAKKAVELAPKEAKFWSTLGAAQLSAGNWKEAVAAFNKSMELRKGGDSNDWFFLAMAHWQLGDKEKARSWYDKAVQWMEKNQPMDEELKRFRKDAEELLQVKKK
jgi:serine/threonine protein kinase